MCERGGHKSRKGQTEACFFAAKQRGVDGFGKMLNDPTQEVIHRRLSHDIGLIWREERSFSRHRQRFVWVKFGREWVYTLGARVLIRNGQALQKYIASIRASVDFRANWPTEPLPDARQAHVLIMRTWCEDRTVNDIDSPMHIMHKRFWHTHTHNITLQYMKRFGLEKNWQNLPMWAILVKPGFACTAVVEALTRAGVGPA